MWYLQTTPTNFSKAFSGNGSNAARKGICEFLPSFKKFLSSLPFSFPSSVKKARRRYICRRTNKNEVKSDSFFVPPIHQRVLNISYSSMPDTWLSHHFCRLSERRRRWKSLFFSLQLCSLRDFM